MSTASGLVFVAEFFLLGYPLVRRYVKNVALLPQLFYSHVLSTSFMITVLWMAYSFSTSITVLLATQATLISVSALGTFLFISDFLRKRRRPSKTEWGLITLISFGVILAIISAVTLPFWIQGDAYEYYVPIGRFLNQYPGAYVHSYYRFSLSRNFGYFALYAGADMLGGSFGSYLFLPIPFLMGTILGIISVSKRMTNRNDVPLIAAMCYVFSVFFGILLKYNMFYLGNLLMATVALLFSYFLISGAPSILEKVVVSFSAFAMLLLYDFTLLLLIPLVFGYIAYRKPGWIFYVVSAVSLSFVLLISRQSLSLEYLQVPQLDLQSSLALFGLILLILACTWRRGGGPGGFPSISIPTVFIYVAAVASILLQITVNLFNYGFRTLADYSLSNKVLSYTKANYYFYLTPPNVSNTLVSVFFSDAFLGWGLLFTAYGLFLNRKKPATTFFLTILPLIILVESINNNYLRFGSFLVPLIVVYLAGGLHSLGGKNALFVGSTVSFLALIEKGVTMYPRLDFEHMALFNQFDIAVVGLTVFSTVLLCSIRRFPATRSAVVALTRGFQTVGAKVRSLLTRGRFIRVIGWRGLISVLILILCVPVVSYNVLVPRYAKEINSDASIVDPKVLPLIPNGSTVITAELIDTNFGFYKNVVVISMNQPWILESFLRLQIANETELLTWLSASKIGYVFVDRGFTAYNLDAFNLFDQLSRTCQNYSLQCSPLYDDGRFTLMQINSV